MLDLIVAVFMVDRVTHTHLRQEGVVIRSGDGAKSSIAVQLARAFRVVVFLSLLGLLGCSLLVGGGDYSAGQADAGSAMDAAGRNDAAEHADSKPPPPGTAAILVSSGPGVQNWCAVTFHHDVECWGNNHYGQLGNGSTTPSTKPVKVALPGPASVVSVGALTTCALLDTGAVMCWGNGSNGELGNNVAENIQSTPVAVQGLATGVVDVSSGFLSACAVKKDGTVWCWGLVTVKGPSGPIVSSTLFPIQVSGITTALSVSVGNPSACAILKGGAVVCWGGEEGIPTLGNGTYHASVTPVPVTGLASGVSVVSVGVAFSCAVKADGGVECWGTGSLGQLGPGSGPLTESAVPVPVTGLKSGVRSVAAGFYSACALKNDGTVWCWGFAEDGQLGDGSALFADEPGVGALSPAPVKVEGLTEAAVSLSTGIAPCVATASGGVDCWGRTCEIADTPVSLAPLPVTNGMGPVGASAVSVGDDEANAFACAVTTEGAVACWGSGLLGELGDNSQASSAVPLASISILDGATAVSASPGGDFACAVVGGLVECWGDGQYGTLGDGDAENHVVLRPTTVLDLTGVTAISTGNQDACAVTSAGAVYCWGDNSFGQLGNGSTKSSDVPVAVPSLISGVTAVAVGNDSTCALLADGSVDCWGGNTLGELGDGTQTSSLTPKPVPGLAGVTSIATGNDFACAVAAGSVYCWGYGVLCELGNESCTSSNTPLLVPDMKGASQVAAGYQSACAIVDGAAWCWGNAAIGDGDPTEISTTPAPVTGLGAGVSHIAVGYSSACAIVGGALKCWGTNSAGQLGNRGAVNNLLAAPVPGFP